MNIRYKPQTSEEVLALFRQRKISTQRAAELLKLSHSEFTKLASQHGIYTSDCHTNPELMDLILGRKSS
jgi:predicted HTH domain antitoxin